MNRKRSAKKRNAYKGWQEMYTDHNIFKRVLRYFYMDREPMPSMHVSTEASIEKTFEIYEKKIKFSLRMLDIQERIQKIIKKSLKSATEDCIPAKIAADDIVVFGDVHGQADLMLQNLFVAGIIDQAGRLRPTAPKTVIQLGDMIDRGHQELEGVVYLRWLQQCANSSCTKVVLLAGNHELELMFDAAKTYEKSLLKRMLIQDVTDGRLIACHADDKAKVLHMHGGLQKEVLLRLLYDMSMDPAYASRLAPVQSLLKVSRFILSDKQRDRRYNEMKQASDYADISGERIYRKFVFERQLTLSDLANYINQCFKELITLLMQEKPIDAKHPASYLFMDSNSILNTRKKAYNLNASPRGEGNLREFIPDKSSVKYLTKPYTVVGHNVTFDCLSGHGIRGGVMQNRGTIYIDAGLNRLYGGNQAFLCYNSENPNFHAVEILDNHQCPMSGLNHKGKPISLQKKKDSIKVRSLSKSCQEIDNTR